MESTKISIRKGMKMPKAPIVIVGLPGIGNVGKLVAEHLRRALKAERMGTIYSIHFPHNVIMLKNGKLRFVNNSLYLVRAKDSKSKDIVILTGDVQAFTPEGQYQVNHRLFKFLKDDLKCSFIYTIGGYSVAGEPPKQNPRVFGNATSENVIKRFKDTNVIFGKSRGLIWGSAGLIVAFARMHKTDAICLMGETSMLEVDAGAAKSVIVELSKILNIKVNTKNLDKIINQTAQIIKQIEQQQPEGGAHMPVPPPEGPEHRPSYIR